MSAISNVLIPAVRTPRSLEESIPTPSAWGRAGLSLATLLPSHERRWGYATPRAALVKHPARPGAQAPSMSHPEVDPSVAQHLARLAPDQQAAATAPPGPILC